MKRPEWMKEPLKNEQIDRLLFELGLVVIDPIVQQLYEYIKELEDSYDK